MPSAGQASSFVNSFVSFIVSSILSPFPFEQIQDKKEQPLDSQYFQFGSFPSIIAPLATRNNTQ